MNQKDLSLNSDSNTYQLCSLGCLNFAKHHVSLVSNMGMKSTRALWGIGMLPSPLPQTVQPSDVPYSSVLPLPLEGPQTALCRNEKAHWWNLLGGLEFWHLCSGFPVVLLHVDPHNDALGRFLKYCRSPWQRLHFWGRSTWG